MKNFTLLFSGLTAIVLSFSLLAGEKEDLLLTNYRAAFESGDAEAFGELVYPEGVTDEIRSKLLENFQFNLDLNMALTSVEISELTEQTQTENVVADVSYKLNLEPTARLKISLSMTDEDGNTTDAPSSYLIGEHEDKLYITTAVPVEVEKESEAEADSEAESQT